MAPRLVALAACLPHVVAGAKRALIVVDMQNDFVKKNGALSVADAPDIIENVNTLISQAFDVKVFTEDFHPENHVSFASSHGLDPFEGRVNLTYNNDAAGYQLCKVDGNGIDSSPGQWGASSSSACTAESVSLAQDMWPDHCVQQSEGQLMHAEVTVPSDAIVIKKGFTTVVDSYGVFGNNLEHAIGYEDMPASRRQTLTENGVTAFLQDADVAHVYLAGLAFDYCVRYSAEQALRRGFEVTIVEDATKSVSPGGDAALKAALVAEGVNFVKTADLVETSEEEKVLQDMAKKSTLLVVDMQNDFITGSLKVPNAADIIPVVNQLVGSGLYDMTVFTEDFHPFDHVSFASQHDGKNVYDIAELRYLNDGTTFALCDDCAEADSIALNQTLWPDHCVQNTNGQLMESSVVLPDDAIVIKKGFTTDVDSYGVFGNNLEHAIGYANVPEARRQTLTENGITAWLQAQDVERLVIVGLAFDFCVRWSAEQALRRGFEVTVVSDATASVFPDNAATVQAELEALGIEIVTSADILGSDQGGEDSGAHGKMWWPLSMLAVAVVLMQ